MDADLYLPLQSAQQIKNFINNKALKQVRFAALTILVFKYFPECLGGEGAGRRRNQEGNPDADS